MVSLYKTQPEMGLNLAFRLYLVLLAICLPAFGAYYAYLLGNVKYLHDKEVDDIIVMSTFRLEDWLANNASDPPTEADQADLEKELKRLLDEPNGIGSVNVFSADGQDGIRFVAGFGSQVSRAPSREDLQAFAGRQTVRVNLRRGEEDFLGFSIPYRRHNIVRGVIRMHVFPGKTGRWIPALQTNLIVGAAGLMLVMGIGVAAFFYAAVRRPIRDLMGAMKLAGEGDLAHFAVRRSGEIGWLAGTYNQMIRRLQASVEENRRLIEQVKAFNEELKIQVTAATRELAAKNDQLHAAHAKLFQIQRQMTMLEKLSTLGQIATTIAHELGTPLNAISGHLQLLQQEPVTDPRIADRLKIIDGQVDRLAGIVKDVLRVMRMPPPRLEPTGVNRVLRDVAELIAPVAQRQHISVDLRLDDGLPLVAADADQLEQVFMNLFTNAMDAMDGGGRVRVTTALEEPSSPAGGVDGAEAVGRRLRIEIEDTGRGMDEDTLRRVFEPFFTTKGVEPRAAADGGTGLGLGLAICRQIVKQHGGEILAHSEPGRGTRFILRLPLQPEAVPAERS